MTPIVTTDDPQAAAERNRRSWNAVVPVHASHRRDEAAFFAAGGLTLFPEEQALLGDVSGLRLLHMLCNAGQDTLSLANLGANVVGVDISDEAIATARHLAAASAVPAEFVRADAYAYLADAQAAAMRFDRIYAGYGVICWLYDLRRFAEAVAALLAPGGRFVLMEFHPTSNIFDQEWRPAHDYPQGGASLDLAGVGDYVGAAAGGLSPSGFAPGVAVFQNPHSCRLYRWGLAEVVAALIAAGLRITALHEYPFVNGEQPFARMRPGDGRRFYPPHDVPAIPLMYGIAAEK